MTKEIENHWMDWLDKKEGSILSAPQKGHYYISAKSAFTAGYTAAQSKSGWVKIEDMPEEWKDPSGPNGGYVDILNSAGCRFPDAQLVECAKIIDGRYTALEWRFWKSASGYEIAEPTHVMLPPLPPQKDT